MDPITKICSAVVIVITIGCAAALTWHGALSGAQFLGLVVSAVGLPAVGATGTAVATKLMRKETP